MEYFHTSYLPVELSNKPIFLSLDFKTAVSWDGFYIYKVKLNVVPRESTTDEDLILNCNPTEEQIRAAIKDEAVSFSDMEPPLFETDTTSILVLNPLKTITTLS